MDRFEGNRGLAVFFGLSGLFMLGFVAFVVRQIVLESSTFTLATAAAGVYGMGGLAAAGLFLLWFARDIAAGFVLDDQGITRHEWGRTIALPWRDLVRFDELTAIGFKGPSKTFGRLFLHGRDGQRVVIRFHLLPDGPHLRARLEPRLAPLRDADLREITKHGRLFRPVRTVGILVLSCMAPIFLVGGLCGLNVVQPGQQTTDRGSWYIGILAVGASPLLAILSFELISRKLVSLTANGHLASEPVFSGDPSRSRVSRRSQSTSRSSRSAEEPTVEHAKIRAENGQCITLESSMPGYRPVLDLIRSHMGAKAHLKPLVDSELA